MVSSSSSRRLSIETTLLSRVVIVESEPVPALKPFARFRSRFLSISNESAQLQLTMIPSNIPSTGILEAFCQTREVMEWRGHPRGHRQALRIHTLACRAARLSEKRPIVWWGVLQGCANPGRGSFEL